MKETNHSSPQKCHKEAPRVGFLLGSSGMEQQFILGLVSANSRF